MSGLNSIPPHIPSQGGTPSEGATSSGKSKKTDIDRKLSDVANISIPRALLSGQRTFRPISSASVQTSEAGSATPTATVSQCHEKAVALRDYLKDKITLGSSPRTSMEVAEKNQAKLKYLLETLNTLTHATETREQSPAVGLEPRMMTKLDQLETILKNHFSQDPQREISDFLDVRDLDLLRLANELVDMPSSGRPIDVIEDETTRINWEHRLRGEYSVPYQKFYDKVILGIFYEKQGDKDFKNFITYLINPMKDKEITAYQWKQFVDLMGPIDKLRENVLELEQHAEFVGNMSRPAAEATLRKFHEEHPGAGGKCIIRLTRSKPGEFIITTSLVGSTPGQLRFVHTAPNKPQTHPEERLGGKVAQILYTLYSINSKYRTESLPIQPSLSEVLHDLSNLDSIYISPDDQPFQPDFDDLPPFSEEEPFKDFHARKVGIPVDLSRGLENVKFPTNLQEMVEILTDAHLAARNKVKFEPIEIQYIDKLVQIMRPLLVDEDLKENVREMYRDIRDWDLNNGFSVRINPKDG